MKALILDTCGPTGSVSLVSTEAASDAVTATIPGRSASERLLGTIKDLCASGKVTLHDLGAIAVVNGPGSFTGVRVGVSAAKGLCEALDLPVIAISRLAVLAGLAKSQPGTAVRALLDAGRGDFYSGLYVDGACIREQLLNSGELLSLSREEPGEIVVCEAAVAEATENMLPLLVSEPVAKDAVAIALDRLRERRFADLATLDANYLRRTDAQIFAKKTAPARPAPSAPITSGGR